MPVKHIKVTAGSQAKKKKGKKQKSFKKGSLKKKTKKSVTKKAPVKVGLVKITSDETAGVEEVVKATESATPAPPPTPAQQAGLGHGPEPLAVVTTHILDFYNGMGYNSPILATLMACMVEDSMSLKYAEELIDKLKEADPDLVKSIEEEVETNVAAAGNTLAMLEQVLGAVRKFDHNLRPYVNKHQVTNNAKEIAEKYGGVDDFLLSLKHVSHISDHRTVCKLNISRGNEGVVKDHIDLKSNTAILATNLKSFGEIMKRGCSLNLYQPWKKASINWPDSQLGWSAILDETPLGHEPNNLRTGKVVKGKGSLFDRQGSVQTPGAKPRGSSLLRKLGFAFYPAALPFFDMKLSPMSPLQRSKVLVSQFVNEMVTSAGIGRLIDTELGQRFGVVGNNNLGLIMEAFTGQIVLQDFNLPNDSSMSGHLVVGVDGKKWSVGSAPYKVRLFDGNSVGLGKHVSGGENPSSTTSATEAFAKGVVRSPNKNKMPNYDTALQMANDEITTGLEFYQQLHCRDMDLKLLTSKALFTRILKEVNESVGKLVSGFNTTSAGSRLMLHELAMFAQVGRIWNNTAPTVGRNMAKMMLHKIICGHVYKKLHDADTPVFGWTPSWIAGRHAEGKTTTVKVKKNDEPEDTFTIKTSSTGGDENKSTTTANSEHLAFGTDENETFFDAAQPFIVFTCYAADAGTIESWATSWKTTDLMHHSNKAETTTMKDIYENHLINPEAGSLCERLANVFIECYEEAQKIAKGGPAQTGLANSERYTRASGLDAGTLVAMIFETATALAFQFSPAIHGHTIEGVEYEDDRGELITDIHRYQEILDFAWTFSEPFPPSNATAAFKTHAEKARHAAIISGESSLMKLAGEPATNTYAALSTLINCSETNNFASAYDATGLIQSISPEANDATIISSNAGDVVPVTYGSVEAVFTDLALERDVPFTLLLTHAGFVKYCVDMQSDLINIGTEMVKPDTARKEIKNLLDFVSTPVGKNFVSQFTDFSLEVAKDRIKRVLVAKESSVYRSPKITQGELVALGALVPDIAEMDGESAIFMFVGLPTEYYSEVLLPEFQLIRDLGSETSTTNARMLVEIESFDVFSKAPTTKVVKSFSPDQLVDSFSFEEVPPNANIEDVINKVKLKNGMMGKDFWTKATQPNIARNMLLNEVRSHLFKKMFSIITMTDFFEYNLVDFNYNARDMGAVSLANKFATISQINNLDFSGVFPPSAVLRPGGGAAITDYSAEGLLKLAGLTIQEGPTATTEFGPLSFGAADMFADLFSSLLFRSSLIGEFIFSPAYFDKTMCICFSPADFKKIDNDDGSPVLSDGEEVNIGDHQIPVDKTASKVSINTYECNVTLGNPISHGGS